MAGNGQVPIINLLLQGNPIGQFPPIIPVSARSNEVVACAVCGGVCKPTVPSVLDTLEFHDRDWMHPMIIKAKPGYNEWRRRPSTAQAFNRTDDHLFVEMRVSDFFGRADGFIVLDSEDSEDSRVSINTDDSEMAIPVHRNCLKLAKIFCRYQARFDIDFRSADGGAPSSIAHLYEIWCKRAIAICPSGVMTKPFREPSNFLGSPCPKLLSNYIKMLKANEDMIKHEADPTYLDNITNKVVCANLQPLDTTNLCPSPKLIECWARIEQLPREIGERILEAIEPFEDGLTRDFLTPTRIIPSNWWREKLMSGSLIPWLFDLDDLCIDSYSERCGHQDWDWELLCRQLAQPDVFEAGGILHGAADNLWNRHRIWKVLCAARLGHMFFEYPVRR
ncbi:hypothetical protein F5X96DRAFT_647479 [Biscogniauxia mediterranea]|nr:hypothetical protein F5X96DRAFT_647479 [Biscogniauxia mediterranea]